jgi:hypothetical protein
MLITPNPSSSFFPCFFFFFFMCVGFFNLEQDRDLEKHYNLLQVDGKFGYKQDNNAT